MPEIVPKAAAPSRQRGKVTPITDAPGKHRGGRQSSVAYDPATGEESRARGSRDEFDALALNDGSSYREDRFYTRSVNKEGHGEKLSIRVPQGIDSQMYKAVAEIAEYHTMHDLIRDAVMHRLEYLQRRYDISPDMEALMGIERLKADDRREDQIIESMRDAVADLDASLKFAWESGDMGLFVNKLERGSLLVDQLREPWREQTTGVLAEWKATSASRVKKYVEALEKEHDQ